MRHVNIVFLVFVISKSEGVDCLLPLREKFAAPKGKYIFHRKAPHQYEGLVLAVRRRRTESSQTSHYEYAGDVLDKKVQ